ncbi:MAG: MarR family winged helix-turn-helix transcriptional regulator [Oscillospiraceae bacterium]
MSKITALSQQWIIKQGLNPYTVKVIYALSAGPDMTQKKISQFCGMPKQTVNKVIQSLLSDEYVILTARNKDKREKAILLTEKGREYSEKMLAPVLTFENKVIQKMGMGTYENLLICLSAYSNALESEMEENK